MKPILFNTEMVCAILENRKTVTRRFVKGAEDKYSFVGLQSEPAMLKVRKNGEEYPVDMPGLWALFEWDGYPEYPMIKSPYCHGEILYVRETFCECCLNENYRKGHSDYCYKASIKSPVYGCINHYTECSSCKWRPSIHMPREAARIFLRVTDVRAEKLQDITPEQAMKEGVISEKNRPFILYEQVGQLERYARNKIFPELWDKTMKPSKLPVYGWDANPYVFVIEFCRISKEEALKQ